jgi:hypothetical protein
MQRTDFERFRAVMTGMAKLYERELDAPLLDAYWLSLRDWDLAQFEAAAAYLMQTCEFMPRPAAFTKLREASRPSAGESWARVLEHIKGAYRDGAGLDDGGPIDRAVQALGGYAAIAFRNIDHLHFVERRFVERYDELCDAAAVSERFAQALDAPLQHFRVGRQ